MPRSTATVRFSRFVRRLRAAGPSVALLVAVLAYVGIPLVHHWSHNHGAHAIAERDQALHANGHFHHGCDHSAAEGELAEGEPGHDHGNSPSAPQDDSHDCPVCATLAFSRALAPLETTLPLPAAPVVREARTTERVDAPRSFKLADAPPRGPPTV